MHARNRSPYRKSRRPAGFSLTELLVVIGIIVLLAGLLLVALGQVRKKALRTRTEATMNQFANACTAFQAEHGFYPGVIPDDVLLADPKISCTENALLHLMGGYRVLSPAEVNSSAPGNPIVLDYNAYGGPQSFEIVFGSVPNQWKLKVDLQRIGEGPFINGKVYGPYYTPGSGDVVAVQGQVFPSGVSDPQIPDLVDAWGQPIIFLRQVRNRGLLIDSTPGARPQFPLAGVSHYLASSQLGELSRDQTTESIFGLNGSGALSATQMDQAMAALLAHQAFYKSAGSTPPGNPLNSQARGAFVLWSAGADGIYCARMDGPGSAATPIDTSNIDNLLIKVGPRIFDEFDDVRVYGGG